MSASDVMLQELRGNDKFDEVSDRLDWLYEMVEAKRRENPTLPPGIVQQLADLDIYVEKSDDLRTVLAGIREMQVWLADARVLVQKILLLL